MNVIDRVRTTTGAHHIVAEFAEGEPKRIPIPTKRKRWEVLAETLDALPWTRLTVMSSSGDVLRVISAEADVAEDDSAPLAGVGLEALVPFARMLADAVKSTQSAHSAEFREALAGYRELSANLLTLLQKLGQVTDDAFKLARVSAAAAPGGDADGAEDAAQFAKLMELVRMAQMAQAARAAAAAAPKPNGKKAES